MKNQTTEQTVGQIIECTIALWPAIPRLVETVVESIVDTYLLFTASATAERLEITARPIEQETRDRLTFECLCMCVFLACSISDLFFVARARVTGEDGKGMASVFRAALVHALQEHCRQVGLSTRNEIVLVAVDPEPRFGHGSTTLDPMNRLEEYRKAAISFQGSEVQRFGKWIGKALDTSHYPILELIGGCVVEDLLKSTNEIVTAAFDVHFPVE
jgi:hypothetical protein